MQTLKDSFKGMPKDDVIIKVITFLNENPDVEDKILNTRIDEEITLRHKLLKYESAKMSIHNLFKIVKTGKHLPVSLPLTLVEFKSLRNYVKKHSTFNVTVSNTTTVIYDVETYEEAVQKLLSSIQPYVSNISIGESNTPELYECQDNELELTNNHINIFDILDLLNKEQKTVNDHRYIEYMRFDYRVNLLVFKIHSIRKNSWIYTKKVDVSDNGLTKNGYALTLNVLGN